MVNGVSTRSPDISALTGLGAATSLGAAVPAAAAARAGLARPEILRDCLWIDEATHDPVTVTGYPAGCLTDGFEGEGRLAQLTAAALEDLLSTSPSFTAERSRLFIALPTAFCCEDAVISRHVHGKAAEEQPEPRSALGAKTVAVHESGAATSQAMCNAERHARRWLERILEDLSPALADASVEFFFMERQGTIRALSRASEALSKKTCDQALVLACDSLTDPPRAQSLIAAGRVKTADSPTGFVPGEAAVAVQLERADAVRRRSGTGLAFLSGLVMETPSDCSSGRVLAGIVEQALTSAALGGPKPGTIYLDLNGENHRASEWGHAVSHLRAHGHALEAWAQSFPALSFGETGTASPLLAIALAVRSFARGYGRGNCAVPLVVGDDGCRSAVLVQRTTQS